MATLRTPEERMAIAQRCAELEREGGDILGYLWSENYLTPRAPWCNIQREFMGRKPYQYTDGKPKKKGERTMNKHEITTEGKRKRLDGLIERIKRGMGIRAALRDMGYDGKSAGQTYRQIRVFAIANDPEAAKLLPARISEEDAPVVKVDKGMPKEQLQLEAGKNYEVSAAGAMAGMKQAADEFFGKCEEMGLKVGEPKITKPLMHSGKTAIGWEGAFGTYIYDRKHGYIDYESNDGEEMSMPVDAWKDWMEEIREVAALLGVEL